MPVAYEMRFENGKIDRVDLCKDKDKVYVKVLDIRPGARPLMWWLYITGSSFSLWSIWTQQ